MLQDDTATVDPVGPTSLRYRVEGMDCPSCAGKIETAVGRVQGAGDVRVNYQRQVLAFQLDEALTPRAEVEGRIRKLGYGVAPVAAPEIVASDGHAAEPIVLPHPKMLPRRRELSQPNAPWFHSPLAAAKPSRVTDDARSDVPVSAWPIRPLELARG